MKATLTSDTASGQAVQQTVYPVLFAVSFSHLLNDTLQAVVPAIYPVLKESFHLNFKQIGLITLIMQLTASVLQPVVGALLDKNPKPYSLAFGMGSTMIGIILLAFANSFPLVLLSVALMGLGSAVFHPEASRMAYSAAGPKRGMAQSLFQVGGNAGSAIGPLLAAIIVVKFGQPSIIWFTVLALLAILILSKLGSWYKKNRLVKGNGGKAEANPYFTPRQINISLGILLVLIFSKFVYNAALGSYYTFYLIDKFGLSVKESQLYLFLYLASVAAGTYAGGPIGDKYGRRFVIWFSILGCTPFTLLLPHVDLFWTATLSVIIGLIMSSAFSAMLVYAQELLPGKVGTIAGLFFGLAFGIGGIASAALGALADTTSLYFLFLITSFLPLLGIFTAFLPKPAKIQI
jgi:FSR family fosmidomycin resistance protein-like MFS transporter